MKFKIQKKSTYYQLFIIAYSLYFIPRYIEYTLLTSINWINDIITPLKNVSYLLCAGLFVIRLLMNKTGLSKFIVYILFGTFFVYASFKFDAKGMFPVMLFGMAMDQKMDKDLLHYSLHLNIFMYLLIILLSICGIIGSVGVDLSVARIGVTTRNSMGFNYPGQLAMQFFPIIFLWFYDRNVRIKKIDYILFLTLTILVYLVSGTLMSTMIVFLFLFLDLVVSKHENGGIISSKIGRFVYCNCPLIFVILMFVFIIMVDKGSNIGNRIDALCSFRFSICARNINSYGIHPWGSLGFVNYADTDIYNIVDSEYMFNILSYGYVFFFVILVFSYFVLKGVIKKGNNTLSIVWFLYFLNSIVNNGAYNLVMNPFSVLAVDYAIDGFQNSLQNKYR